MDYSLLYRHEFSSTELEQMPQWDVFLSAFNKSGRVRKLYDAVKADRKEWVIHPEYDFAESDLPTDGDVRKLTSRDEAEFWQDYFIQANFDQFPLDSKICVDITGFMRPHIMLLPLLLRERGFTKLDVLYADPQAYQDGDETPFTKGAVTEVRQVRSFEGIHNLDHSRDVLVIGAGYDDELIRRVAEDKLATRKLQMFGLPSLQPHMYGESRRRVAAAEEAVGVLRSKSLMFAPANDPFATAQELHDRLKEEARQQGYTNLYLSPLATKAQTLGFALYYLCECVGTNTSMIFPFAEYYSHETSVGLSRVWLYRLELDWFNI